MKRMVLMMALMTLPLAACQKPGQTTYTAGEVGVSRAVEYGTVTDVKEVTIVPGQRDRKNGESSDIGLGTLGGAGVGGGAASYVGGGSGSIWSAVGGAVVGGLAGHAIEDSLRESSGYEYMLEMQNGDTKTIVLEKHEGDDVFKSGDKVMLQYCDAGEHSKKCKPGEAYQRLIKVEKFPAKKHRHTKHSKDENDTENLDRDDIN